MCCEITARFLCKVSAGRGKSFFGTDKILEARDNSKDRQQKSPNIYKKAVRGGAWLFAVRIFTQVISFARMAVLMRLLMPADFGLLGFATLVLAMVMSFSEMGFQEALIQKKDNAEKLLDVAWTTNILRGAVLCIVIFITAPVVAVFFDSSKPFNGREITAPANIIESLSQRDTAFSTYMYSELSGQTKGMVDDFDPDVKVNENFADAFCADLNRIAEGKSIYTPERFDGIELGKYVTGFVERPQPTDNTFRVNKLLIQQAYPFGIRVTAINLPTCVSVIRAVALLVLLAAFNNIGIVYFTKELDFHKTFYFQSSGVIVSSIVSIVLALIYRNVWSLVLGKIVGAVISTVLSYMMHPYRPKISFDTGKFKELWEYGRHVFAIQIMKFFCLHGDDIILAKMLGATALGFYQKAYDVGNLVAAEIGNKVAEVGFPAYSKLQDNLEKVRAGYLKSVHLTSLVVLPITGGLFALAPEFVKYVFTEKWIDMVPALRVLLLLAPFRCMQRAPVFMGLGRPDIVKKMTLLRLIIIAVTVYPLTKLYGMCGTAISVFLPVAICDPLGYYYLDKLVGAKPVMVIERFIISLAATVIMCAFIAAVKMKLDSPDLTDIAVTVFIAGIIYTAVVLAGRMFGPKHDVVKLIREVKQGF